MNLVLLGSNEFNSVILVCLFFSLDICGLDWVLREFVGFTGLYWVKLGFYWVLLGFSWLYLTFAGFYWVLIELIGCFKVVLSFVGLYGVTLGYS